MNGDRGIHLFVTDISLREAGASAKSRRIFRAMYRSAQCRIRVTDPRTGEHAHSAPYPWNRGTLQGGSSTPVLLCVLMAHMLQTYEPKKAEESKRARAAQTRCTVCRSWVMAAKPGDTVADTGAAHRCAACNHLYFAAATIQRIDAIDMRLGDKKPPRRAKSTADDVPRCDRRRLAVPMPVLPKTRPHPRQQRATRPRLHDGPADPGTGGAVGEVGAATVTHLELALQCSLVPRPRLLELPTLSASTVNSVRSGGWLLRSPPASASSSHRWAAAGCRWGQSRSRTLCPRRGWRRSPS